MSRIETPDRPEALTAIVAIALFIPLLTGIYTSCDGFKKKSGDSVVVEQQTPPPAPGPAPGPGPTPGPNPNPGTLQNQWLALNNISPPAARSSHSAVWTGNRMIVWGGLNAGGALSGGASLDPTTGTWTAISNAGSPGKRYGHTAAWNGTQMVVWGGTDGTTYYNDGYAYTPATNSWAPLINEDPPAVAVRAGHSMVYTGQTFLMWGGGSTAQPNGHTNGGHYLLNTFWNTLTATGFPVLARISHSAVWTGSKMIMFGGQNNSITSQDGFIFDPTVNVFTQMTVAPNTPSNRAGHTAAWTGSHMLVWGGLLQGITTSYYGDGRMYEYATTNWTTMTTTGAPAARAGHTAVWAGDAMIIWGGTSGPATFYNDGAVFH